MGDLKKPAFKGACAPRLKVSAPRDVIVRVYADIGVVLQFQEYAENIKNLIHILAIMEGFHWVWLDWHGLPMGSKMLWKSVYYT